MDDYYSITTEVFATMRLTIEGAIALYEGICAPIYGMLRKEDTEAARAYSIIGRHCMTSGRTWQHWRRPQRTSSSDWRKKKHSLMFSSEKSPKAAANREKTVKESGKRNEMRRHTFSFTRSEYNE